MIGINLVVGIMLLTLGRKLFWLFVGVAGFLIGMDIGERFLAGPHSTKLILALLLGILCAFLAVLYYRVAIAIAGFAMGGYIGAALIRYFSISMAHSFLWVPYVIGGLIGAVLIFLLFDWALIVLSSLAGTSLIVHSIARPTNEALLYLVLAAIGILIQSRIWSPSRRSVA